MEEERTRKGMEGGKGGGVGTGGSKMFLIILYIVVTSVFSLAKSRQLILGNSATDYSLIC